MADVFVTLPPPLPPPTMMTTTSRDGSPHPIPPLLFGAGSTPCALVLSSGERDCPAAAPVLLRSSPLLSSIRPLGRHGEGIPSATTTTTMTIDRRCDPRSRGGGGTELLSFPPCNPAGTSPLSTSECNRHCPATSPRIWLRRSPSNRDAQSPPRHRHCRCRRGRWHCSRCHCRPAIAFSTCRRKGGEDGGPCTQSAGLPPRCRTAASPPSPTTIPPRVLCDDDDRALYSIFKFNFAFFHLDALGTKRGTKKSER